MIDGLQAIPRDTWGIPPLTQVGWSFILRWHYYRRSVWYSHIFYMLAIAASPKQWKNRHSRILRNDTGVIEFSVPTFQELHQRVTQVQPHRDRRTNHWGARSCAHISSCSWRHSVAGSRHAAIENIPWVQHPRCSPRFLLTDLLQRPLQNCGHEPAHHELHDDHSDNCWIMVKNCLTLDTSGDYIGW